MLEVVLCCCVALLAACLAVNTRELRRMTLFLRRREPGASARVTVGAPVGRLRDLAAAINGVLDADQAERVAARRRSDGLQRGLSSLSHDIRTPLMGAKGRLQLAEREEDPAARSAHLAAASARLDDVEALLDQLFSYARAMDPDLALELEEVQLVPLLEHVLAVHFAEFEAAGMEPELDFEDEGVSVTADREALARVLENVVANALRHGTGARLRVVQRGRTLSLSNEVSDPASIDPEHLFDRFWRADPARGGAGSGIGLSVVAALCERMGLSVAARLDGDVLTIELSLA